MLHAIAAIFLIQVDDGFSVAAGAVVMSLGLQRGAQLRMVVDFAIENDPDVMIFVGQRLVSALDVDDAKPPHGQTDILFDEEALVVRPAMHDAAVHARQHVAFHVPVAIRKRRFRRFRT